MSCLILDIIEIVRHSNLIFSRQKQDSSAVCSVQFNVKCIVYKKHELIYDCKVQVVDKDGHFICKNEHAAIYIKANKALQSLYQGDSIIAITGAVKYTMFQPNISINAYPFAPIPNETPGTSGMVFNTTVEHSNAINTLMAEYETCKKRNSEIDKKVHSFFVELLYPYKTIHTFKKIKLITELKGDITISLPHKMPLNNGAMVVVATPSKKKLQTVTDSYENVIGSIMQKYIDYENTMYELCIRYNTMEKINQSKKLWNIYTNAKIDVRP